MSDKNLQVGAYGWLHPHWEGSFYPEDLPVEWFLSYYSNEFNTVMVPAHFWRKSGGFDCEEWLDEIHDDFRFYVECPEQVLSDDEAFTLFLKQLAFLQSHLAGVLLPDAFENIRPERQLTFQSLKKISRLSNLFGYTKIPEPEVKPVWQTQQNEELSGSQLAIFQDDLKQLRLTRAQVEKFVGQKGGAASQDIIVKYGALSASDLMKFRSVIEIMGL